jgi:hypothetical protein
VPLFLFIAGMTVLCSILNGVPSSGTFKLCHLRLFARPNFRGIALRLGWGFGGRLDPQHIPDNFVKGQRNRREQFVIRWPIRLMWTLPQAACPLESRSISRFPSLALRL